MQLESMVCGFILGMLVTLIVGLIVWVDIFRMPKCDATPADADFTKLQDRVTQLELDLTKVENDRPERFAR